MGTPSLRLLICELGNEWDFEKGGLENMLSFCGTFKKEGVFLDLPYLYQDKTREYRAFKLMVANIVTLINNHFVE